MTKEELTKQAQDYQVQIDIMLHTIKVHRQEILKLREDVDAILEGTRGNNG